MQIILGLTQIAQIFACGLASGVTVVIVIENIMETYGPTFVALVYALILIAFVSVKLIQRKYPKIKEVK